MFATITRGKGEETGLVELEDAEMVLVLLEPPAEPTVTVSTSVDVTVCVAGAGGLGGGEDGLKRDRATEAIPPTASTSPNTRDSLRKFRRESLALSSPFPDRV